MKRGYLYVAHDNDFLDYGTMTYCSALSLSHHTYCPIALITDNETWDRLNQKHINARTLFSDVIITPKPITEQQRRYRSINNFKNATYYNQTRSRAFDLTPFDETVMIDSDMIVIDDQYDLVWGCHNDMMINTNISRLIGNHDDSNIFKMLSELTIPILWATVTYFKKNSRVKAFFDLVSHIRENYEYFSCLYGFESLLYRNDYAFSIASHIMSGYTQSDDNFVNSFPVDNTLFAWDNDLLLDVERDSLLFSVDNKLVKSYSSTHVMNKYTFLQQQEKMIEVFS